MNNNDNNENESRKSPSFRMAVELVAIGVVLYVSLNHLDAIGKALVSAYMLIRPLMIGGLVALILNTPMVALEKLITFVGRKCRLKTNRDAVAIIALVLTFGLAILLIYAIADTVVPQTVESIKAIMAQSQSSIPELVALISKLGQYGIDTTPITEWLTTFDFTSIVAKIGDNAISIVSAIASNVSSIISGASSVISGTVTALTAIIFSIYVLANKNTLGCQSKKLAYAYLKKSLVDRGVELCSVVSKTFSNFISGQCLDACLLGLLVFVAMTIFRFPYALAVSALITVTAVIPYVGAFLGGAFGVLLMIIDDPIKALLFVILFIVCQQIDNHLLYPRVVGGSVGLPAIWTFAAVIVGGSVWGVVGMVLFIPLFSVGFTLLKRAVYRRLGERQISVEALNEEQNRDPFPEIKPTPEGEPIIDTAKIKDKAKKTADKVTAVTGSVGKGISKLFVKKDAGNSSDKSNGNKSSENKKDRGDSDTSDRKDGRTKKKRASDTASGEERRKKLDFPEDGDN